MVLCHPSGSHLQLPASRPSRAAASGVALLAVLMIIVDDFSTVIFPYQGNPILGGLAQVSAKETFPRPGR